MRDVVLFLFVSAVFLYLQVLNMCRLAESNLNVIFVCCVSSQLMCVDINTEETYDPSQRTETIWFLLCGGGVTSPVPPSYLLFRFPAERLLFCSRLLKVCVFTGSLKSWVDYKDLIFLTTLTLTILFFLKTSHLFDYSPLIIPVCTSADASSSPVCVVVMAVDFLEAERHCGRLF